MIEQLNMSPADIAKVLKPEWRGNEFWNVSKETRDAFSRNRTHGDREPAVRNYFAEHWNSNAIDSDLMRIALFQEALEEFKIPLLALQAFSVAFQSVPLEGTDKVGVPFYPLQTASAQSWNAST